MLRVRCGQWWRPEFRIHQPLQRIQRSADHGLFCSGCVFEADLKWTVRPVEGGAIELAVSWYKHKFRQLVVIVLVFIVVHCIISMIILFGGILITMARVVVCKVVYCTRRVCLRCRRHVCTVADVLTFSTSMGKGAPVTRHAPLLLCLLFHNSLQCGCSAISTQTRLSTCRRRPRSLCPPLATVVGLVWQWRSLNLPLFAPSGVTVNNCRC